MYVEMHRSNSYSQSHRSLGVVHMLRNQMRGGGLQIITLL